MSAEIPPYLNRELSWLEFNRRVLFQATDKRNPLLERVKFLQIFTSNLDEFFMKRVDGLKRQVLAHVGSSSIEDKTPQTQLTEIRKVVLEHLDLYEQTFKDQILPGLKDNG